GHEDRGSGGAGFTDGLGHGVEDGNGVFELLAALAGSDAGDEPGAVFERELGVAGAEAAGDALYEDLGVFVDEDGHGRSWLVFSLRFSARTLRVIRLFLVEGEGVAGRIGDEGDAADGVVLDGKGDDAAGAFNGGDGGFEIFDF